MAHRREDAPLNVSFYEDISLTAILQTDYHCIVGYFCDNVTGQMEKHDVFYYAPENFYYISCIPQWEAGIYKNLVIPEEKVCRYKDCPYVLPQSDKLKHFMHRVIQVGTFQLMEATTVYEYSAIEYDNDHQQQFRDFIYDFERPKDFKYFFLNNKGERIFIWFDDERRSIQDLVNFDAKPRYVDIYTEEKSDPTQSVVLRNKVVYDALTEAYRRFIDEYGDNCETPEEFYGRNPNSVSPDDYFTYLERQVESIMLAEEAMHKIVELPKKRKCQIKEPDTYCNACNNTFWWSRGSGRSAKEEALKSEGLDEDSVNNILSVQLGNDSMPLVPCYICNFEGHKPCIDLTCYSDSQFWYRHFNM
jgi:hypothetical protein